MRKERLSELEVLYISKVLAAREEEAATRSKNHTGDNTLTPARISNRQLRLLS